MFDSALWSLLIDVCRSLQVPLDYKNWDHREAGIAILKVPAKVSPDSDAYRGPVLINPGPFTFPKYRLSLKSTFDAV